MKTKMSVLDVLRYPIQDNYKLLYFYLNDKGLFEAFGVIMPEEEIESDLVRLDDEDVEPAKP